MYLLLVFDDFLSQIRILSKYLNDVKADIVNSIILKESTKKIFFRIKKSRPDLIIVGLLLAPPGKISSAATDS